MAALQRATVYFDRKLYRALKVQAALSDRAISDLVNEAVRNALLEDARDSEIIRKRSKEPTRLFSDFVRELKREQLL
jgi:hypothetical protein